MISSSSYIKFQIPRGGTTLIIMLYLYPELNWLTKGMETLRLYAKRPQTLSELMAGLFLFVDWTWLSSGPLLQFPPGIVHEVFPSLSAKMKLFFFHSCQLRPAISSMSTNLFRPRFWNISTGLFLGGGLPTQNSSTHSSAVLPHFINPFQSIFTNESVNDKTLSKLFIVFGTMQHFCLPSSLFI